MAAIAAAIAPAAAAVEVDPFDAIVDPEIFDKARVCKKTKRRYLKRRTKFKAWCAAKYPDWYDTVSGEVDLVALAGKNGGDSLAFKQYVMTNKGTKGRAYARHSTLSKERSMLFDYVCDAKKAGDMRPAFWIELKQWYIGIKNKENQEKAAGTLSCKEGKDELPEKMYRKFAELWLSEKPFKPGVFAFLYGSLSWMLMARTTNVSSAVLLGHFTPSPRSPRDDDFRVKNDEKCALCAKRAAFIFYVAVGVFAASNHDTETLYGT